MNLQPKQLLQLQSYCKSEQDFLAVLELLGDSWKLSDEARDEVREHFIDPHSLEKFESFLEQAEASQAKDKPLKIMVVDDDPPILIVVDQMLKMKGYDVSLFLDGKSCLETLQREVPDLIILDINMPDINGAGVFAMIRQNPHTQYVPVLFQSGVITEDEANYLNSKGIGTRRYIRKPFTADQLHEIVGQMLNQRHA